MLKEATRLLFGRDLFHKFNYSLFEKYVQNACVENVWNLDKFKLSDLFDRYEELFRNELGTYNGEVIKLELTVSCNCSNKAKSLIVESVA